MTTAKVIIVSAVFTFSSVYAMDSQVKLKSYSKAIKTLQKKTIKILNGCGSETSCVANTYDAFVLKRDKLVKSKLHIEPKHFKRVAKKTLKTESQCIKKSPSEANLCFKKHDPKIYSAVASLS